MNIFMNDKAELEYMKKSSYENLVIHCTVPENCSFLSQSRNCISKIWKLGKFLCYVKILKLTSEINVLTKRLSF